jgi:hypothetical protein
MAIPWYRACRALSNHKQTWSDVLSKKEITNWIFSELRGFILEVPPSLADKVEELVRYCLLINDNTDNWDHEVQLYCGCVILKQLHEWEQLFLIAKFCTNEKKLKVVLDTFHATGEVFSETYIVLIDVLQESKWSEELHSQCTLSLEWGLAWCSQPGCTPPTLEIVKNCLVNVRVSKSSDESKQKLQKTLLQVLPPQICKDLILDKVLDCSKVENLEQSCIVPNRKRFTSDSMHQFYQSVASLQHNHKNHQCTCYCDCSNCWFRVCSEA